MEKGWTDRKYYWVALHLIPGLGSITLKKLIEKFESPEKVFEANVSELMEINGLGRETAKKIYEKCYTSEPSKYLKRVEGCGARVILYEDPAYPSILREIHDPPMLLYIKGSDFPPNLTFIGVVGSRNPTHYGLKAAEKIGQGLARRGLGVVSGMARGIDSAAHWGCLGGRGFTVAVLGTGIDIVYPQSNKDLFQKIIQQGAVISEFPLGSPPEPKNFPIRNRIISGLSKGIVVVEATMKSGSLITASLALEQGRDVFAVPGSINSFKSTGSHFLIKQGARLIENSDDILEELGLNYRYVPKTDTFKEAPIPPMGDAEKVIYEMIGDYPIHIDQIVRQGNFEPGEVLGILMKLELKGIIKQLPGRMFVK